MPTINEKPQNPRNLSLLDVKCNIVKMFYHISLRNWYRDLLLLLIEKLVRTA